MQDRHGVTEQEIREINQKNINLAHAISFLVGEKAKTNQEERENNLWDYEGKKKYIWGRQSEKPSLQNAFFLFKN